MCNLDHYYTLTEYSYLTGKGHTAMSAIYADTVADYDFDGLDTYAVERFGVTLAEFNGCDAPAVFAWFADHPDYDGRRGCKAWKGECSWCGKALVDGKCDCDGYVLAALDRAVDGCMAAHK